MRIKIVRVSDGVRMNVPAATARGYIAGGAWDLVPDDRDNEEAYQAHLRWRGLLTGEAAHGAGVGPEKPTETPRSAKEISPEAPQDLDEEDPDAE